VAYRYANEIFSLGREFMDTVKGRSGRGPLSVVVGVSDVLAKSIVHRILAPAFHLEEGIRVVCRQDRSIDAFMADLATHAVDVVLADAPAGIGTSVRAFSHLDVAPGAGRVVRRA
jgi:LysR family transcriptional regulator, transcriptional activator of nhaA